jgi:aerobic carbon-monoxide dehydrogenase large subunit
MSNYVGAPVRRKEDDRFLRGNGRFVADIQLPGMLEASVVRSAFAHADVTVNAAAARTAPGVAAVFTGEDIEGTVEPFTRLAIETPKELNQRLGITVRPYRAKVLALSRVFRVGEPIALVVAFDRYLAEDAAELVEVEYEPLDAVTDPERAIEDGAPQLHPEVPGNIHATFKVSCGDVDRAFSLADHVMVKRFRIARSVGVPVETRGCVAEWNEATGDLTLWATTQRSHWLRSYLSEMLHIPEDQVRVVAPDMGGSFGSGLYPEDILIAHAAKVLGRPVRWIEDRQENLGNARHARDQVHDVEISFNNDGRITGLRGHFLQDSGAYNPYAVTIPYNTVCNLRSEYKIDNFSVEALCVLTNKMSNTPVRGAGRGEATFVIDRLVDMVAKKVRMDPADVRLRNLIPAEEMPYDMGINYRDGAPMVYDSGDFPTQLQKALDAIGYEEWRRRQTAESAAGRRIGIGISAYVEGSGVGPFEAADVKIDASGMVTVSSGSNPHGQSHETTLAQVCADAIGVPLDSITVRAGDTSVIDFGGGTNASRSAVTAGMAVRMVAEKIRDKVVTVASSMLEVDPSDVVIEEGWVFPAGAQDRGLSIKEIARALTPERRSNLPEGIEPGLHDGGFYFPPTVTFASGTHVAVVEVDDETGFVRLIEYVVVDDCGIMLNPMVVEGQIHGGVAHGIGNALYEEAVYDDDGQLLTGTFMDYLLPTSTEVPRVRVVHDEYPTPLNPLGVKGAGEGGAVSPPAAIANAICDALAHLGVEITEMPVTPDRLFRLIQSARSDRDIDADVTSPDS